MKLPDFLKFAPLNELKRQMGRQVDVYGSFAGDRERLTAEEQTLLQSGAGIEVSFDELRVLEDKTLAYKNSRVLLYIRDVHVYGGEQRKDWYPRYHLSHCSTLKEMTADGRFARYVIAAETSGEFMLNMFRGSNPRAERRRLPVCQNCLDGLAFDDFSLRHDRRARLEYVGSFTPALFFAVYPRSLHPRMPRYTSDTAPMNNYPEDFDEFSRHIRQRAGWRCDRCCCDLSDARLRRYLHVHHRNGDKSDSRPGNLQALCIACHAEQPRHGHLKTHPNYKAFQQLALSAS